MLHDAVTPGNACSGHLGPPIWNGPLEYLALQAPCGSGQGIGTRRLVHWSTRAQCEDIIRRSKPCEDAEGLPRRSCGAAQALPWESALYNGPLRVGAGFSTGD